MRARFRFCLVGLMLFTPVATAQEVDAGFSGRPIYIDAEPLEPLRGKDRWKGRLGGGLVLGPRYPGDNRTKALFNPDVEVIWNNFLFLDNDRAGVIVVNDRFVRAGVMVHGRTGRDRREAQGVVLPDLDPAAEVGVFASTAIYKLFLNTEVLADVSSVHGGTTARVETGYVFEPTARLQITPILSLAWASGKFTRTYFDLAPPPGHTPVPASGPGLNRLALEVVGEYILSPSWRVRFGGEISGLLGDAHNSALARSPFGRNWQPSVVAGVAWTF